MQSCPRRYVVTGGPGSGKTTLLSALSAAGHAVLPEAGRAIIQAQRGIGGPAGHGGDHALFAELMLSWDMRSHAEAPAGVSFFDRGVPDLIGYLRLCGLAVPRHFVQAAERIRYAGPVFVAPAWEAIYANDAERTQGFAEAVATEQAVVAAWREFGYETLDLPRSDVPARARFVLARCG